jgi:hypothetical protein
MDSVAIDDGAGGFFIGVRGLKVWVPKGKHWSDAVYLARRWEDDVAWLDIADREDYFGIVRDIEVAVGRYYLA